MSGLHPLKNASTVVCPWNANMTWDRHEVTDTALHNLTFVCPFLVDDKGHSDFEDKLENPATFFVQVARLSLTLLLLILITLVYNSLTVLGRTVLSVAMCSIYWILMFLLLSIKAMVFVVLVPSVSQTGSVEDDARINQAGFVSVVLLQCGADMMLLLALDHEQRFRSSDYATLNSSPYSHVCAPVTCRRVLCSWYRVPVIIITLIPLILLAAVEITFQVSSSSPHAPSPLVWILILSLFLPRLYAIFLVVRIFFLKEGLRPTTLAKVFLVLGLVFSVADHLPSSVTTIAPYAHHSVPPSNNDCQDPCQLRVLTIFDLFQLLGCVSVIFYTLFIRSQYLRIENECKLAIVWDMQRLLNINGREEIVVS
jgi:hypothetical protein